MLLVSHPPTAVYGRHSGPRSTGERDPVKVFPIDPTVAIKFWHTDCDCEVDMAGRMGRPDRGGRSPSEPHRQMPFAMNCANFLRAGSFMG